MKVSFATGGLRSLGEMSTSLMCNKGITLSDTLSTRAEHNPPSKATQRLSIDIEYQMRRRILASKGNDSSSQDWALELGNPDGSSHENVGRARAMTSSKSGLSASV